MTNIAAFNIRTGSFEIVARHTKQACSNPPYQCQALEGRSAWVNERDKYIVWVQVVDGKSHNLLHRFDSEDFTDIGKTIDDFRIDRRVYDTAFLSFAAKNVKILCDGKKRVLPATHLLHPREAYYFLIARLADKFKEAIRECEAGQTGQLIPPSVMLQALLKEDTCVIDLDASLLTKMLEVHRFGEIAHESEMHLPLARFADLMARLSGINKCCYITDGTKASSRGAMHFVSHVDIATGQHFNSELLIKPFALQYWLKLAEAHKMHKVRAVCYGVSQEEIEDLRDDGILFYKKILQQRKWLETACLSPHGTTAYRNKYPEYSYVLGLLLLDPAQGWHHHYQHTPGGTDRAKESEGPAGDANNHPLRVRTLYQTLRSSVSPLPGVDAAVAIFATEYVLPVGIVRSFDRAEGWLRKREA